MMRIRSYCQLATRGFRPRMEDELFTSIRPDSWSGVGVFDGHAGKKAAQLTKQRLPKRILQKLNESKDAIFADTKAIHKIFQQECATLQEELRIARVQSGSTAVMIFFHPSSPYIHACWVGDSRAIVGDEKGECLHATQDHKPTNDTEKQRIMETGGFIENDEGVVRVNGYLSLSRAFGDFVKQFALHMNKTKEYDSLHAPLIAIAECASFPLPSHPFFVLLACDGLWDVFSNKEVTQFITTKSDVPCMTLLKNLTTEAIEKRHSYDNVSMILLRFGNGISKPREKVTEQENLATLFSKLNIRRKGHVRSRKTTKRKTVQSRSHKRNRLRSSTRKKTN